MKIFLLVLFSLGMAAVSARSYHEKATAREIARQGTREIAPWLKTREEEENEKMSEALKRSYEVIWDQQTNQEKRAVLELFKAGQLLLTKASDIIDTAETYKSQFRVIMGYFTSGGPPPATKEDIDALKNQLTAMDAHMKASFSEVMSGQTFSQVLTNYKEYIDHLESVVMVEVLQNIGNENLSDKMTDELVKHIIGGSNADSTEFALLKTHEMINGGSIFQLSSLYEAVADKHATCTSNCKFNINDLPVFASEFNTLQAAAYGALIAAYNKQGNQDKATTLEETMKERMTQQVEMLHRGMTKFLAGAGSGKTLLRLRSARGGCFAYRSSTKAHLRDCDDRDVLKVRVNEKGTFFFDTDRCFSYYMTTVDGVYCERNRWDIQISKVDPRYMIFKAQSRCLAANMGDPRTQSGVEYTAVDRAYRCALPDDAGALTADTENQFWEFLPEN